MAPVLEPSSPPRSKKQWFRQFSIKRVAVLGAGTMGARIAAHIANAGLPVLLLDMVPVSGERNQISNQALINLKSTKPAAFTSAAAASLVNVGNFDDDLTKLSSCDWIIEAVAEDLDIKRNLLASVAPHVHSNAIMTTNTSGLPVATIGQHLPLDLRRRWFGTHFFNPPRYMRLLEIIPTEATDTAAVNAVSEFADRQLGKEVVPAQDVPNFIANRIGVFSMLNTCKIMGEQHLDIEEVDLLTGDVIGWPKSGTFRLADLVGIDVLGNVARNFVASTSDERPDVIVPNLISELMERKWLGDKTKQGFYKKERRPDGTELRLVLDSGTFEYKPCLKVVIPALEQARRIEPLAARLRALLSAEPEKDKAARFYLQALPELCAYAANRIGEVTESLVDIDRAMVAGFNWELGPFALWDAAGFEALLTKMQETKLALPASVQKLLAAGGTSWYRADRSEYFDVTQNRYVPVKCDHEHASIASSKRSNGIFSGNAGISLIDVGDGIGCLELHSKMNSIGNDTVDFLLTQLQPDSEAVRNFDGFIIATDAANFSVGANLMQILKLIEGEEWDDIGHTVTGFQAMTQAVKFCSRPVVAAPVGLALGGGCEIAMHAACLQPHLELYMGLVEAGVGLIPAGGGCKEMLLRALADADTVRADPRGESVEVVATLRSAFEAIAMAKVSTSAVDARSLRLIGGNDVITMNRSRLIADAKIQVLRLVRGNYRPPISRRDIPAPGANVFASLKLGIYLLREGEFISDHDAKVATHIARILTGGDITPGTLLTEQHLLDLEREAFLFLCAEPKTTERIAFTLKTGKALRN
jgi:3-hydroxyacyl-CoA dehydrogenase